MKSNKVFWVLICSLVVTNSIWYRAYRVLETTHDKWAVEKWVEWNENADRYKISGSYLFLEHLKKSPICVLVPDEIIIYDLQEKPDSKEKQIRASRAKGPFGKNNIWYRTAFNPSIPLSVSHFFSVFTSITANGGLIVNCSEYNFEWN